jgi:DNA-binding response OmpR family regulator
MLRMEHSATGTCEIALPEMICKTGTKVGSPIRILLVEDDPETAELLQINLTDDEDDGDSFRLEWTRNLVEAMIRLAQPGIDVVLLDLGLPELSGHKSYLAVEAATRNKLPVVIFTADDRNDSRDLTLAFGAADYLVKDKSSPAQLRQALRHAVMSDRPGRRDQFGEAI